MFSLSTIVVASGFLASAIATYPSPPAHNYPVPPSHKHPTSPSKCACTNGVQLMQLFIAADGNHNARDATLLHNSFDEYAIRNFDVYIPQGHIAYQPGGEQLTTLESITRGLESDLENGELDVHIGQEKSCTVTADYIGPINAPARNATIHQVMHFESLPPGNKSCTIVQIDTYACSHLALSICPTILGGPPGRPLPRPGPRKCKPDIVGPCQCGPNC